MLRKEKRETEEGIGTGLGCKGRSWRPVKEERGEPRERVRETSCSQGSRGRLRH